MSPERKLFLERMAVRNYSPKTVENYVYAVRKPALFHNKSPVAMDSREIEQFLLHELKVEKLEPSTVNLHIGALKTFFKLVAPEKKTAVMSDIQAVKTRQHELGCRHERIMSNNPC